MQVGIDFGTTRTVVAASDRGNYPVVSFEAPTGDAQDYFPSVVAERAGELRFGWDALSKESEPGWAVVRSFKRWLATPNATPEQLFRIGSSEVDAATLVGGHLSALREALIRTSNLPAADGDPIEATISTPANAFATQRLVTLEAFRKAGFRVRMLLNEPSAAGVEYAHQYRKTLSRRREKVLVYDLGGGTFDASVVDMQGKAHDVVSSRGLNQLGGDDFDGALLDLALRSAGVGAEALSAKGLSRARSHCREAKESLHANSRRVHLELGRVLREEAGSLPPDFVLSLPIARVEEAWRTLIDQTMALLNQLVGPESLLESQLAGLYVVGGGSTLPAVARALRERYGRRVRRSQHPSGAVAMGLAIAGDVEQRYALPQRFHHNLGVFREQLGGASVGFDSILGPEMELPGQGEDPLVVRRQYQASHNIGHFRFVECGYVDRRGEPGGDIRPFRDVWFAFDPALRGRPLDELAVARSRSAACGPTIEEEYRIDPSGAVELTIVDTDCGYRERFRIAG